MARGGSLGSSEYFLGRPYVPFSASAGRTPPGSGGFHYISSPVRTVSIVPVVHPDRLPNLPGGLASTQSTASAQVAFAAAVPSAISGSPAPALAVSVVPAGGGAAASESSPPKKRRGRGPGKKKVVAPPVSGSPVSGGLGGRGRGRGCGRGRGAAAGSARNRSPARGPAPRSPPASPAVGPPLPPDDPVKALAMHGKMPSFVHNREKYGFLRKVRAALRGYEEERAKPDGVQDQQATNKAAMEFLTLASDALAVNKVHASDETTRRREVAKKRVEIAMAALRADLHGERPDETPELPPSQGDEIMAAINCGNIGRAGMVLQQDRSNIRPSFSEADGKKIEAMHPKRPYDAPPIPQLPDDAPVAVITDDQVRKAIGEMVDGKAPGIDGWTSQMLKTVAGDRHILGGITQLVKDIVNGVLPPDLRDALSAARVAAIEKSIVLDPTTDQITAVSYRPVSMGSIFTKLASRIMKSRIQTHVNELFHPVQRGEGMPGGVESCVHTAQAWLEQDEFTIGADFDSKNAFNTLDRAQFFTKLFACKKLDAIWRLVDTLYRDESRLFLFAGGDFVSEITSSQGSRQGCVFGSLLYCLGTFDLLLDGIAATGVNLLSIADDIKAFGTENQIYAFSTWLLEHMNERTALTLEMSKSSVFYPNPTVNSPSQRMLTLSARLGIKIQLGGAWPMFGAAVGLDGEAKVSFVENKVLELLGGENALLLQKLESHTITAQASVQILRSVVCPALNHILRCMPPTVTAVGANRFRAYIYCFLTRKLAFESQALSSDSWAAAQLSLPVDMGGGGIADPLLVAGPAYLASLAASFKYFVVARVDENVSAWEPPEPDQVVLVTRPLNLHPPRNLDLPSNVQFVSFAEKVFAVCPTVVDFSDESFVAGPSDNTAHQLASCLSDLRRSGILNEVNKTGGILPDKWHKVLEILTDPPPKLQHLLYRHVAKLGLTGLIRIVGGPDSRDGRRIIACQDFSSGYWITQPIKSEACQMTDTVYRLAFASRFGLIPYVMDMSGPPILCSHRCAGVDMRQDPFHKIHCPGENKTGRNKEHNNFQYSYLELADLCNVPNEKSSKKYAGVDPKDPTKLNKQRPDMVFHFANGSHLADVRGVDPMCDSALKLPIGKYAEYAGNQKVSKYKLITAREHFEPVVPIIFTTLGGLDKKAVALVDRIVRNFKGPFVAKTSIKYQKITELVVGIMKDNAQIIQRAFTQV